ncbi:PIN domain-containing protein [Histidinibacterium aquaticum]|uniref:PIN domain-containing protein n=2 Tax=Histidinibacterium aquaticum TaxID=2613962 RepID=A0A5J5GCL3_9RHOB|nr:PIN domain-containing protein [Histidinibacterium aquaticum]
MRQVLLGLAREGFYAPRWSARVLEEWALAAAKLGPAGEEQARVEVAETREAFPEAEVGAASERGLSLPDPNDLHVLAAAVASSCDGIVTENAKDFPRGALADEGLARIGADQLAMECFAVDAEAVARVGNGVLAEARRLSGEDWEIRPLMRKARMPKLGKALAD